jgi:hypothetical protein
MGTIVQYTDRQRPQNDYPKCIVSPTRARPCCFSDMEELGTAHETDRWVYQYKRCRQCGFTVRVILREIPNEVLVGTLRRILETSFQRNVPE